MLLIESIKIVNGHFFSSPENVEKVWGLLQRKTCLNVFHWPTKAVIQHFWRSPLSNWKLKNNRKKVISYSICLLRLCILRVLWCSVCFCTSHFVMVPINLTCPHCLQHIFIKHLFYLYIAHFTISHFLFKSIFPSGVCTFLRQTMF